MGKTFLIICLIAVGLLVPLKGQAQIDAASLETHAVDQPVTITLASGEEMQGNYRGFENGSLLLDHPDLGPVPIPLEKIKSLKFPKEEKPKIWEIHVEGGINGSSGNAEKFDLRGAFGGKRQTERNIFTFEATYDFGYGKDEDTQITKTNSNRATLDARSEWLFKKIDRLTYFVSFAGEYDEFTDYDFRIAIHTGLGWYIIKTKTTTLIGRLGFGVSREFGGTNDVLSPEALAGLDFEHLIGEIQKITASAEIFPDLRDIGEFRTVSKAGWEVFVTTKKNLSVKLGLEHRYDSTPGPMKVKNDLDYFATLIFKF